VGFAQGWPADPLLLDHDQLDVSAVVMVEPHVSPALPNGS
jgi:hypothetical protein